MDPNTTYNLIFSALASNCFIDARRHYKALQTWLNKRGFEPRWAEIPEGWAVNYREVDCFNVPAGQVKSTRRVVSYSYSTPAYTITISGLTHMAALGRLIDDMETLANLG